MKKMEFNKEYCSPESNTKFEFYYSGMIEDDYIEKEDLDNLLNHFLYKTNHYDMIKNVSYLRTVFKEFKEELLFIRFSNKDYSEEVMYKQTNLFLYDKKSNSKNKYEIEYDTLNGFKTVCLNDEYGNLIDFTSYLDEIKNASSNITKLNEVKAIELDTKSKILAEIYNLFYGENPNFTADDIDIKFQTMLSILCNFGISTAQDYNFINNYNNTNMPGSFELREIIEKLYPLGEVEFDKPKLTPWAKKVITAAGSTIRETFSNPDLFNDALIILSEIMWAAKYDFNQNIDLDKIVENSGRNETEINSCIQLVKKINTKIDEK